MIALQPTLRGAFFTRIQKEELKKYFGEIRKVHYAKIKADQERLQKLENLRLAALNKDKKINLAGALGGGKLDMSMFRNMMKKDTVEESTNTIKIQETNADDKPRLSFKNLASILSKEKPVDGPNIPIKSK